MVWLRAHGPRMDPLVPANTGCLTAGSPMGGGRARRAADVAPALCVLGSHVPAATGHGAVPSAAFGAGLRLRSPSEPAGLPPAPAGPRTGGFRVDACSWEAGLLGGSAGGFPLGCAGHTPDGLPVPVPPFVTQRAPGEATGPARHAPDARLLRGSRPGCASEPSAGRAPLPCPARGQGEGDETPPVLAGHGPPAAALGARGPVSGLAHGDRPVARALRVCLLGETVRGTDSDRHCHETCSFGGTRPAAPLTLRAACPTETASSLPSGRLLTGLVTKPGEQPDGTSGTNRDTAVRLGAGEQAGMTEKGTTDVRKCPRGLGVPPGETRGPPEAPECPCPQSSDCG